MLLRLVESGLRAERTTLPRSEAFGVTRPDQIWREDARCIIKVDIRVKKVLLMVAGMVVVRLSPILGNTQNSTPCQIRREWKWMRRRESWRVLSKISPHRSPDAPIPPIRLCPNLCVSRTILGLGHPCRRKWSKYRRRRRMRRRWGGRRRQVSM